MAKNQICNLAPVAVLLLAVVAATSAAACCQTYTILYTFDSNKADPVEPSNPGIIAQGRDGNLYTTTTVGGKNNGGAVFRITQDGTLTKLHSFAGADGSNPVSGLTLGRNGNFYGTTSAGGVNGDGTVFKITQNGKLTVLHSFSGAADGSDPIAPPIQGKDGNFYGTTFAGGANGHGTIYKMTPSGALTTLYAFSQTSGFGSVSPLTQGTDGQFYGATSNGGQIGKGTIFKITSWAKLTVIRNLACNYACSVEGAFIQASDGYFYGTAASGGTGSGHRGAVIRLSSGGKLTLLYSFDCSVGHGGCVPIGGLVQAGDGNFYGTTVEGGSSCHCGTIFRITPQGTLSVLHEFSGQGGGAFPRVTLLQNTNGIFYGDTLAGGNSNECNDNGCGVFYSWNMSLDPFVTFVGPLSSGKVGKSIQLLGQNFTGATAVSFNGTAASYIVKSDTFLTAIVPVGATPGFVTVNTPSGMLTSNKQFIVKP
jgi:uncharacterized repeat protein (TIGR03803 family)